MGCDNCAKLINDCSHHMEYKQVAMCALSLMFSLALTESFVFLKISFHMPLVRAQGSDIFYQTLFCICHIILGVNLKPMDRHHLLLGFYKQRKFRKIMAYPFRTFLDPSKIVRLIWSFRQMFGSATVQLKCGLISVDLYHKTWC